ncbi:MAG: FAD-binding oxidoreductase [Solirubrobacterales bacterium]|nr:FAD-binding oxidoreductase [Solirubrobacterales bacterium]
MRWWGWGDDAHAEPPAEHALAWLEGELGGSLREVRRHVALEEVALPASRLPAAVRDAFGTILRDDHEARVRHAAGRSYPDLVRLRTGALEAAPDAVLAPRSHDEVVAVLRACAEAGVAVVPFGGGTSVVAGVDPARGACDAVVSLDLGALCEVVIDERSRTALLGPGLRGPEAEAALGARGLTLGHFPQSFEYASIGGFVATRSAGQASTGYGRIDDLVLGLRLAAPAGEVHLPPMPATAAGPGLRGLLVGSEGTLGVLTQVALRVARAPQEHHYEGFMVPSFGAGAEALRELKQDGLSPDLARLSDEAETRMSLAVAGTGGVKGRLLGAYLGARHVRGGSLLILGWEGEAERVRARRAAALPVLRRHGAAGLGTSPGRAWLKGRYHGPYLRDDLMDRGVFVETLETATQWSNLFTLYRAVGDALRRHAPLVACHVSHVYASGASLYFTFLARQEGDPLEQWRAAKAAACDAIVEHGGTITHHHAVGRDHAPWLVREVGETGAAALRAVKDELDPAGIMNPGKLLP